MAETFVNPRSFRKSVEVELDVGVEESAPILLYCAFPITVAVVLATGGEGKVQYTLDSVELIDSDDAAWFDWPAGDVTDNTVDVMLGPVTAVKLVCPAGTGTATLTVLGDL
jgi:hypothetical protein